VTESASKDAKNFSLAEISRLPSAVGVDYLPAPQRKLRESLIV
jgi:hypothetical protein